MNLQQQIDFKRTTSMRKKILNATGEEFLPRWSMYPVAAVPKTPASTPAVFDSPSKTPWCFKIVSIHIQT
jgi:hypothetical protein